MVVHLSHHQYSLHLSQATNALNCAILSFIDCLLLLSWLQPAQESRIGSAVALCNQSTARLVRAAAVRMV